MYKIKINDKFTNYDYREEHAARLVYGEIIRLAESNRLPIRQRPSIIILYREWHGQLAIIEKWECRANYETSNVRGLPFPKKA